MVSGNEKSIDDVLASLSDAGSYLELTALLSKWQLDIRKVRNVAAGGSDAKPFLNELETIISRLTEDVELKSELFNNIQLKSEDEEVSNPNPSGSMGQAMEGEVSQDKTELPKSELSQSTSVEKDKGQNNI